MASWPDYAAAEFAQLGSLIWTVAAVLVFAIGLSRIYLGVHYPSDVIAGYLAATIWVSTLVALDRLHVHRKARKKQRAPAVARR